VSSLKTFLDSIHKQFGDNGGAWSRLAEHGHQGKVEPFSKAELFHLKTLRSRAGLVRCKRGNCYFNAQRIAMCADRDNDVQLVEGLVTAYSVPIDHSWIEYSGKVYDPTLVKYLPGIVDFTKGGVRPKNADTPEYYGVTVPMTALRIHQMKHQTYSPVTFTPSFWEGKEKT